MQSCNTKTVNSYSRLHMYWCVCYLCFAQNNDMINTMTNAYFSKLTGWH